MQQLECIDSSLNNLPWGAASVDTWVSPTSGDIWVSPTSVDTWVSPTSVDT